MTRASLAALASLPLLAALIVGCPRDLAPRVTDVTLACEQRATAPRPLSVSLLVSPGVDDTRAALMLGAARAYWQAQGVELVFASRERAPLRTVVTEPREAPPDARAALAAVLAPAAHLLRERARSQPATTVDVVLLPRLTEPRSSAARFFTRLDGFTLSPLHRDALRGDAEVDRLYQALALDQFRPTIFLAVPKRAALPEGEHDLRLAHEVGHVFGLDHAGGERLMSTTRVSACPTLTDDERAVISRALDTLVGRPPARGTNPAGK